MFNGKAIQPLFFLRPQLEAVHLFRSFVPKYMYALAQLKTLGNYTTTRRVFITTLDQYCAF
jgi:hypothetical protein